MSLFRKPKKQISRRVFSAEDDANRMDVDEDDSTSSKAHSEKRKDKKSSKSSKVTSKSQLLSFDDEDEGEIFQVKKSSHSKKVMKQLDKERRRKEKKDTRSDNFRITGVADTAKRSNDNESKMVKDENPSTDISIIRTDDFVLVVKKSDPEILNGRAALCAGRDDMSSDEEESNHKFTKPDQFKIALESGVIPDAAMIFAARKRRQKAREESDFIPVVEEEPKKGKRNVRDEECSDDEERIDMSAVTGYKEREERKEKFYSVQQEYSGDESEENESHEWENQQIRKGVTGAQLMSAHQESVYSQFLIQPFMNTSKHLTEISTAEQLQEAYARSGVELKPKAKKLQFYAPTSNDNRKLEPKTKDAKKLRMPQEIAAKLSEKLESTKTLNAKHIEDINKMTAEIKLLRLEGIDANQKAPVAAVKYRFYQEIKCYMNDLTECLDDKLPKIIALEHRLLALMSKHTLTLIERRRQDVRDQAKEMADAMKGTPSSLKKGPEDHERIRRAAEREGRRTRRRRDREKHEQDKSHLDGMSSDDEISDQDKKQLQQAIQQICIEANAMFEDAADEYCKIPDILNKLEHWKCREFESYKDAYVSMCIPKILGPLIRLKLIGWNPLEQSDDFEKMQWYSDTLRFGYNQHETEKSLSNDVDVRLVPALVEKIMLPKLTDIIENCWDPLSTTQTLKLVQLISRLGRDYPSLRSTSKSLRTLFSLILDKMKVALDNDVFIPIMQKQAMQEARSSFFQRQFCSGLKLFRNFLSWQGILADAALKELAVSSLLNRYLLSAMRVCTPTEATNKAFLALYTLPRVWLQSEDMLISLEMFIIFVKHLDKQLDRHNPIYLDSVEKVCKILKSLHAA